uniref:Methyltranfer_dom domain-containing protein n=1 Tax=Caenorhabditis japonica TaxID=281687 RepID=A0A8R1DTK1_CAEJA
MVAYVYITVALAGFLLLNFLALLKYQNNRIDKINSVLDTELSGIHSGLDKYAHLLESKKKENSSVQIKSESIEELFQKMKAYSIEQVPTRKSLLRGVTIFANLYGSLGPEVFCPEKVRIGTIGDGGKWVCNPWKVPNDSVLFSLGLNNIISFEEDWQKVVSNRNRLFGFDVDEQNSNTKETYASIRGVSRVARISTETSHAIHTSTIEDLAKDAGVTNVEILKIDIEGAEKTCLIPFLEKFTVCQIYLEIHGHPIEHAQLLQQIAHLKYRLFSYEVNGYSMEACEYSFIHESCVDKYGAKRVANYLDYNE